MTALVSEAQLQQTVIQMARALGWMAYHSWSSHINPQGRNWERLADRGYPDLCLVHPDKQRLLYVELKSARGKVKPEQQEWLDCLEAAGAEAAVWRPADLDNGEIERVLR